MKKITCLLFTATLLATATLKAQNQTPEGFTKGTIVLADGSAVTGYIKEDMVKKASLTMLPVTGGKKKTYDAYNLTSATMGDTHFLCIQGDFFKLICQGDLNFLQKMSNAGGKMVYNGAEAVYLTGTEGKTGDYFVHNARQNTLQHVTDKTLETVVQSNFSTCAAAVSKAKETGNDIARLKEAIDIYNHRNTQ